MRCRTTQQQVDIDLDCGVVKDNDQTTALSRPNHSQLRSMLLSGAGVGDVAEDKISLLIPKKQSYSKQTVYPVFNSSVRFVQMSQVISVIRNDRFCQNRRLPSAY